MGNKSNKLVQFPHFFFSDVEATYFTGETIHGVVNLDLSSYTLNLKEITIFLICEESWEHHAKESSISDSTTYEVLSSKINLNKIFNDFNPSILLSGNKYTFPFSIFISQKILPTFKGSFLFGGIDYSLEALYDSLEGQLRIKFPIAFKSSYCIYDCPLLTSNYDSRILNSLSKKPPTIFKVIYPYTNYSPSEPIPLIIEIDNINGKEDVKKIEISLTNYQQFYTSKMDGDIRYKRERTLLNTCSKFKVKKGEIKTTKIVPIIPSNCWRSSYVEPTVGGKMIKCFYELTVKVFSSEKFIVKFPIALTERTLRENKASVVQESEVGNFEVIENDFNPNTEYSLGTYEKYDNS